MIARVWHLLLMLIGLLHTVGAITIEVSRGGPQCVFEELHKGEDVSGSYAVVDGSNGDIDVSIKDPNGQAVYSDARQGEGRFTVRGEIDGTYQICFSNTRGGVARKTVDLAIEGQMLQELLDNMPKKESLDRLERSTMRIVRSIGQVEFQQARYRQIHTRHSQALAKTNRRVKTWTLIECLAVVLVTALQILYFKKLFPRNSSKQRSLV